MVDLADRLGVERPILQSGMAGGLSTPELAAAVSRGGGLGSIGLVPPRSFAAAIAEAQRLAEGRPLAVNLLLPFTQRAHVEVAIAAKVRAAVLFYGFRPDLVAALKAAGVFVLHQVGTLEEARRALRDGANGLIAQGLQAGGHLLGREPTTELLGRLRASDLGTQTPILAAGGIARADDVRAARAAGADGVLCGSRFLLTTESGAHPLYQERLLGAPRTIVTQLFGLGWPARHRVVPNQATLRWCDANGRAPGWVGAIQRATARPVAALSRFLMERSPPNRLGLPLYPPTGLRSRMDDRLVELTPLYAGECVRDIRQVVSATTVLADLRSGWP
jgi:NAD(P)H-dependent flavin oxidoreductase YrpB (nitropropane dioxygenase family)